MLIENESNWSTEDLVALTESVAGMIEKDARSPLWNENTLILFKTSRKREKKSWRRPNGQPVPPPVAFDDRRAARNHYTNTIVISIASAARLKLEVLDRLAHIEHRQDMSGEDVVRIASTIGGALGNWKINSLDFSWAASCPMRVRTKPTKSKLAVQRQIEKLKREQADILEAANYEVSKLEERIEYLRKELD